MAETDKSRKCRVCGGRIVEGASFLPMQWADSSIDSLGQRQGCVIHGLYCESCGIVYWFLPEEWEGRREESTGRTCVACGGEIVERIAWRCDPPTEPPPTPLSPYQSQFHRFSEGYYCRNCGLRYEMPLPEREEAG